VSRRHVLWTVAGSAALVALLVWVAANTAWEDVPVPMPPKGEAATNPNYAAQRFVDAMGGRAIRARTFNLPPADGIVVLWSWNWNLSARRREALEAWVEDGGRLVVDESVIGGTEFERWAGIQSVLRRPGPDDRGKDDPDARCFAFVEEQPDAPAQPVRRRHWICDVDDRTALDTWRPVDWGLREPQVGRQVLRVRVGRGSVTLIKAEPFVYRRLFQGDHGWLLAAATQLQPGDEVRFMSEGDYPSLLALVWQTGAPDVVLAMIVLGLALWRNAVRSGPLAPDALPVRRSLGEQIRGTGRFALHYDGGEPLHAAMARAVDEAARRRVAGWAVREAPDRVGALARLAGVAPAALETALHDSRARSPHELRHTLALLETVRRALTLQKRTGHGDR
jgi:hypothetical protein